MRNISSEGKTQKPKTILQSPELCFLLEAHNALSAKISEEAGFEGLWARGYPCPQQWG
jgi:phosphoenolpyruvate phosphomutase